MEIRSASISLFCCILKINGREQLSPAKLSAQGLFHRIVAAAVEGVATEQSAKCHHTPTHRAVAFNRLGGVLRTGRLESARRWKKRRYNELIEAKKCY